MVVGDEMVLDEKNKVFEEQEEEDNKKGIWELFKQMFESKERKDTGKFKSNY